MSIWNKNTCTRIYRYKHIHPYHTCNENMLMRCEFTFTRVSAVSPTVKIKLPDLSSFSHLSTYFHMIMASWQWHIRIPVHKLQNLITNLGYKVQTNFLWEVHTMFRVIEFLLSISTNAVPSGDLFPRNGLSRTFMHYSLKLVAYFLHLQPSLCYWYKCVFLSLAKFVTVIIMKEKKRFYLSVYDAIVSGSAVVFVNIAGY